MNYFKEEANCTLSVSMCVKIIIHTLMCAEIIIHTLNVCENNYSHNECVNDHFCTHSMCLEIIIHTLGLVWLCFPISKLLSQIFMYLKNIIWVKILMLMKSHRSITINSEPALSVFKGFNYH